MSETQFAVPAPEENRGMKWKAFIQGIFSDGGYPSCSRILTACVILATLVFVGYVIYQHKVLPDVSGITLFAASLVAALYGVNTAGNVLTAINKKS